MSSKFIKRSTQVIFYAYCKLQSNTSCILISLVSTVALNLSGFAIMSLFFIHSMALLVVTSGLFIRPWIVSSTAVLVLSSAKLCKSEPSKKNMLLMNMLSDIGPSIDPCGTPGRIYL